ncbi:MFS family permease [Streptomyces phaeoluteigriseus]
MAVVRDLRVLLRIGNFRRLLAVRLLSQCADGVYQVALAAYVVFSPEKQTSATAIASAMAVLLLPYSLVGPFAGVLLDRWRRRQVFLYGNLLRALLASVTAVLIIGGVPDWLFYASALCVTAVNRFVLAGLSAALPRVVDAERLVIANSLSPTAGTLAATAGGGLAFVVRLLVADSDAAVVLLGSALYLCAALASLSLAVDLLGPDRERVPPRLTAALRGTAGGLAAGLRYLAEPGRRQAARALGAITLMRFCYGALTVMMLMLCRYAWSSDAEDGLALLGLAVGIAGVGFFVAALVTPSAVRRLGPGRWIVVCSAVAAVLELALMLPFARAGRVHRRIRPGARHPGHEDRHRHHRPVLRERRIPRPHVLALRRAVQRRLRRRRRSGRRDAATGRALHGLGGHGRRYLRGRFYSNGPI